MATEAGPAASSPPSIGIDAIATKIPVREPNLYRGVRIEPAVRRHGEDLAPCRPRNGLLAALVVANEVVEIDDVGSIGPSAFGPACAWWRTAGPEARPSASAVPQAFPSASSLRQVLARVDSWCKYLPELLTRVTLRSFGGQKLVARVLPRASCGARLPVGVEIAALAAGNQPNWFILARSEPQKLPAWVVSRSPAAWEGAPLVFEKMSPRRRS